MAPSDVTTKYVIPGAWAGMAVDVDPFPTDLEPAFQQSLSVEITVRFAFVVAGLWTIFLMNVFGILFSVIPFPGSFGLQISLFLASLVFSFSGLWFLLSMASFIFLTCFKIIASLHNISASDMEALYYKVFSIGFTWFYDLSLMIDGTALLRYQPFVKVLDYLAIILVGFIKKLLWFMLLFKNKSTLPQVNLKIPRRHFIIPGDIMTREDIYSMGPQAMVYLSFDHKTMALWDDEVDNLDSLIRLSFYIIRLAALFRLSTVNIIFLTAWLTILLLVFLVTWAWVAFKRVLSMIFDTLKLLFFLFLAAYYLPLETMLRYANGFWYLYFYLPFKIGSFVLNPFWWVRFYYYLRANLVMLLIKTLKMVHYGPLFYQRLHDRGDSVKMKVKLQARFNQSWVAAQKVIDDIALPTFIRRQNFDITPGSIQETLDKLKDLGWPVNVSVTSMPEDLEFYEYPEWYLTSIDFRQGIHNAHTIIDEDLQVFEGDHNLNYKRTETYASYANELTATSRYFLFRDYTYSDLAVDDLWVLIGEIFKNSKLTPFSYIIKKWEKKYGLGAFAKVKGRFGDRKLSRRKFIKTIGKEQFEALWAETFKWAPTLDPINPVSVKGEALPAKKWMQDKVRTVIGAPLTSYISSTIWNYAPNHNFKWETTPIKVGMPLNGGSMAKVFSEHSRRDIHFAADCTAFDSTLSGKTLDIIKAVRKKGFENHRDYKNICDLVDNAYWEVQNGVLALTSRGRLYKKGSGLSTGHSSTSMDNSIGLTSLFLRAWKELTNHTAHEFRHFVTLSCYGDDNMCSYDRDVHPNWTPGNIQRVFKQWGIDLRIEAEGPIENIEFLSKFSRRPDQQDRELFAAYNLPTPDFIVYHNRDKLIGKIAADMVVSREIMTNKLAKHQINRCLSFMQLCAHHHDVYNTLVNAVRKKVGHIRGREKSFEVKIPEYKTILENWYFKKENIKEFVEDVDIAEDDIVLTYGQVTIVDAISNFLSRFADFVNPDVYNSGFTIFFQRPLKPFYKWALLHTREANGIYTSRHLATILQKSSYDWMTNEVEVPLADDSSTASSRLLKHWVFMAFSKQKGNFFSRYVLMLDKKIADIKYLLFGHIDLQVRRLDVPLWNSVLAAILGALPEIQGLPDYRKLPFWKYLSYFSIGWFVDTVFGMITNYLFASVPANFVASNVAFEKVADGTPWVIEAATGSGKTTSMINMFTKTTAYGQIDKLVIVEPRQAIVLGVVPYMQSKFALDCTACCEGAQFNNQAKVVYCTPMEVMIHQEWFSMKTIFVIDECHVDEPLFVFAKNAIANAKQRILYTSATPPQMDCGHSVVSGAQVWTIDDLKSEDVMKLDISYAPIQTSYHSLLDKPSYQFGMDVYRRFVVHYLRNANPFAKSLIFVNTKKEVMQFVEGLTGPSGGVVGMWSGHVELPDRWSIIVSTSVADIGITLPSVDHVFTTNSHLQIRGVDTVKPVIYGASPALLKQRRGRTGRTNNGRSIVFTIPALPTFEGFTPIERMTTLISSGVSVEDIIAYDPGLLAAALPGVDGELIRTTLKATTEPFIKPALFENEAEASLIRSMRLKLQNRESGFDFDLESIVLQPTRGSYQASRGWSSMAEVLNILTNLRRYGPLGFGITLTPDLLSEVYLKYDKPSFDRLDRFKIDAFKTISMIWGESTSNSVSDKKEQAVEHAAKLLDELDDAKLKLEQAKIAHQEAEQGVVEAHLAMERLADKDDNIFPEWFRAFVVEAMYAKLPEFLREVKNDRTRSKAERKRATDALLYRALDDDLVTDYCCWLSDNELVNFDTGELKFSMEDCEPWSED